MNRHTAVAFLALALVGLTGCGDKVQDVETSAEKLLVEEGFEGSTVDCPSSIEVEKGSTFDCEVTGSKARGATLRVNDDDGKDLTLVKVDAPGTKGRAGSAAG